MTHNEKLALLVLAVLFFFGGGWYTGPWRQTVVVADPNAQPANWNPLNFILTIIIVVIVLGWLGFNI